MKNYPVKVYGEASNLFHELTTFGREQGDKFALDKASEYLNTIEEIMEFSSKDQIKTMSPIHDELKRTIHFLVLRVRAENEKKFQCGDLVLDEDTQLFIILGNRVTVRNIESEWETEIIYNTMNLITKKRELFMEKDLGVFSPSEYARDCLLQSS